VAQIFRVEVGDYHRAPIQAVIGNQTRVCSRIVVEKELRYCVRVSEGGVEQDEVDLVLSQDLGHFCGTRSIDRGVDMSVAIESLLPSIRVTVWAPMLKG
jgi:hypothetical protein